MKLSRSCLPLKLNIFTLSTKKNVSLSVRGNGDKQLVESAENLKKIYSPRNTRR